jgi:hypothetical protein
MLDELREGHQTGNSCSAAVYFTAAGRQQVMHMTTVKCFCLGGYKHEFNTEADLYSTTYDDDYDDDDWIWLGPEDFNFSSDACVIWVGRALEMESYTNMTFNHCRVLLKHTLLLQLLHHSSIILRAQHKQA